MRHATSRARPLGFKLAWQFTHVLSGEFQRARVEAAGKSFPIVGPVPPLGKRTPPIEGRDVSGPYLYVLEDARGVPRYIGIAAERDLSSPLERWIRPAKTTGIEYWAHGTNKKKGTPTVVHLAEGLRAGAGPYSLYFLGYAAVLNALESTARTLAIPFGPVRALDSATFISQVEHALIHSLQAEWNTSKKRSLPPEPVGRLATQWYGVERI